MNLNTQFIAVSIASLGSICSVALMSYLRSDATCLSQSAARPDGVTAQVEERPIEFRQEAIVVESSPVDRIATAHDYLERYHGAAWDEFRSKLDAKQLRFLERRMDLSQLPPSWEDAEEELRRCTLVNSQNLQERADAFACWSESFYESWDNVREVYSEVPAHATGEQLKAFRAYAEPMDDRVRFLAAQKLAIIADVQAFKWDSGDFDRAPIICVPRLNDPGRRSIYATSGSAGNQWCMGMVIYEDEVPPEFNEIGKLLGTEVDQRAAALKAYIATL